MAEKKAVRPSGKGALKGKGASKKASRPSRRGAQPKTDESLARLAKAVSALSRPADVAVFLREILTPDELHDLVLRWHLLEELVKGTSQRAIAAELGISLCKITRGSRILKEKKSVIAQILKGKRK